MPKYDYECEDGHVFEYWQGIKEEPLERCPVHDGAGAIPPPDSILVDECCNAPVRRLISNTSFVLKGKGWYKDGY